MGFLARLAFAALAAVTLVMAGGDARAVGAKSEWDPSGTAVAIAAETIVDGSRTRLVFTLSKTVEPHAFVLDKPDRVIVDLPEVNFQLPADIGKRRGGLVSSFRYGLFAPGRSRVVIDLAQPALVSDISVVTRRLDGAVLLSIELSRADRQAFAKAMAAAQPAEPPRAAAPSSAQNDNRPVIAIDAGHGGIDPGAVSGEVVEKDIVFTFAQSLRRKLEASGQYKVFMTRDGDVFVPLDDRVRRARAARADLLISIHADTISSHQVRGATVYTGSEQASDAESAGLAERENSSDSHAGFISKEQPEEVAGILQDLTLRETRGFSQRFAHSLVQGLNPVTRMNTRPHREAGFRVLRAHDIPSVLVELGYLSSQQDVSLLTSEGWRDRATGAMASAIDRFFAPRLANGAITKAAVATGSAAVVSP